MDTKLTLNEIECAIAKYFDIRKNIIVCNVSWGMFEYEADMIVLNNSGYLTEVEIKRSLSDFKADFKKNHKHDDARISDFCFAVPFSIKDDVIGIIDEHKDMRVSFLLTYKESGFIERHEITQFGRSFHLSRKLFLEERLQIARLGCMRVWNLKNKIDDEKR